MFNFFHNKSFAQQLIIYISTVLAITFGVIVLLIFSSSTKFINKNAYYQANTVATNTIALFDRRISEIEAIPMTVCGLTDCYTSSNITDLPAKILKCYPLLTGCTLQRPVSQNRKLCICARRQKDNTINITSHTCHEMANSDSTCILKANIRQGYWSWTENEITHDVSYCEPIYDHQKKLIGTLKIDFALKTVTDYICNFKLFNSGFLFIIDHEGNVIAHPEKDKFKNYNIRNKSNATHLQLDYSNVLTPFLAGETGFGYVFRNHIKHYIYYTPISQMNWRMGIVCPYNEILIYSQQFSLIMLTSLGICLLILIGFIVHIIRKFSEPLRRFSVTVRKISDGNLNVPLPESSSIPEIRELHNSFRDMQQNLASYVEQLKKSTAENERISTEMRLAQKIQKRFLPKKVDLPCNIELFADLKQSREVGGDLYDYFVIEDNLYFVIGDVSGKSTPAALYMASIVKLFRYVASRTISTSEICSTINQYMCDNADDDMYITMFMGIMNINTGQITFTNAGHPYPLIIHHDKKINSLDKYPDVPIGILEDHTYNEYQYTLEPGDVILLYTDGITDAENIHAQFYGMPRLIKSVERTSPTVPVNLINNILADINQHIDGARQSDDLTILSIFFKRKN